MNFALDRPRGALARRRGTRAMHPPAARRGVWYRLGAVAALGRDCAPTLAITTCVGGGRGHAYRGARGGGTCRALAQCSACMCQMLGGIARDSAACCADAMRHPDGHRRRPATRTGRGDGARHGHDSARERRRHAARGDTRAHGRLSRLRVRHTRPWPRPAPDIRGTGLAA